MEIKPPNIQLPNLPTTDIKPALSQWRTGQILEATITSQPKSDTYVLKIGNETFQATGKPPANINQDLTAGTQLKLQVLQTTPQINLKVLTPPTPTNAVHEALKQFLPKQAPLPPLLANLAQLNKPNAQMNVPANLAASIEHLMKQLPSVQQFLKGDATTLKQAIKESGVFLENNLRQSQTQTKDTSNNNTLNKDFKANVLKVLAQLQSHQQTQSSAKVGDRAVAPNSTNTPSALMGRVPNLPLATPATSVGTTAPSKTMPIPTPLLEGATPPPPPLKNTPVQAQGRAQASITPSTPITLLLNELSQQIEGALARIRVNQLSNAPVDNQQAQNWSVELPIRRGETVDLVHIHIEEDEHSQNHDEENKNKCWRITLAFNLDELGPMYANIVLATSNVSTTLHAEQPETVTLIEKNLKILSQNLSDAGLHVEKLECHQGKPVHPTKTRLYQTLLDIKA